MYVWQEGAVRLGYIGFLWIGYCEGFHGSKEEEAIFRCLVSGHLKVELCIAIGVVKPDKTNS